MQMMLEIWRGDVLHVPTERLDCLTDFWGEADGREHGEGPRGELDCRMQGGISSISVSVYARISAWYAPDVICKGETYPASLDRRISRVRTARTAGSW